MQHTLLRTHELIKKYPSAGNGRPVVNGVSLEVRHGEFLVIMGSSGSGKSTLLNLLSGLDSPSQGSIQYGTYRLNGKSERALALFRRQHIGFIFQSFNLVPYLTLLENVSAPAWLRKKDRKQLGKDAEALLNEVGIAHLKDRLPAQVSGGEQQRCAIARAFINRPHVVFADEPTGNLNSAASTQVLDLLSHFHRQGHTIVMVTHDPRSAARGDRVLFFQDGIVLDELGLSLPAEEASSTAKEQSIMDWLSQKNW